jgi:hypothetical protein
MYQAWRNISDLLIRYAAESGLDFKEKVGFELSIDSLSSGKLN